MLSLWILQPFARFMGIINKRRIFKDGKRENAVNH